MKETSVMATHLSVVNGTVLGQVHLLQYDHWRSLAIIGVRVIDPDSVFPSQSQSYGYDDWIIGVRVIDPGSLGSGSLGSESLIPGSLGSESLIPIPCFPASRKATSTMTWAA
jgi:hypothetical protein